MDIVEHWPQIKQIFKASFRSSFHFSLATVDREGLPHVTPIGSLILGEPGEGIFFEEFTRRINGNTSQHSRVCVLAVNSGRWFWLRSLLGGRFKSMPAIRLYGSLGSARAATDTERELWQKRVRMLSFTRGHKIMWQDMGRVREIHFTHCKGVNIGPMTRALETS